MSILLTEAGLRSPLLPTADDVVDPFRELLKLVVAAVGEDVAEVLVGVVGLPGVVAEDDLSLTKGEEVKEVDPLPSR